MDIKEAAHNDAAAPPASEPGTARRGLLAAGLSGAAASLLPWLSGRAAATDTTTGGTATADTTAGSTAGTGATTAATDAPTTTTTPPRKPNAADIAVLGFLQTVELTIRDLYDIALNAKVFTDITQEDIATIRQAHNGYQQSISGLIGRAAPNHRSDALFKKLQGNFKGDAKTVAKAYATLENAAVATHTDALGKILATDAAALIASILVVEARHATLLHQFGGDTKLADRLADDGVAISSADYPVS